MGRSFAYAAVGFQTRQDRESARRDASGDGERANRLRAGRRHGLRQTTAKVQRREVEGRAWLKSRDSRDGPKAKWKMIVGLKAKSRVMRLRKWLILLMGRAGLEPATR
jgi:hypothetical protein